MKKLLAFIFLVSSTAMACHNDFDCQLGDKCIIAQYTYGQGQCVTPIQDGLSKPFDGNVGGGITTVKGCLSDTSCGVMDKCVRQNPGDMYGICLRSQ